MVHNQKLNVFFFKSSIQFFYNNTYTSWCVEIFKVLVLRCKRQSAINGAYACTTLEQRHMFSHLSLVGILLNILKLVWRAK